MPGFFFNTSTGCRVRDWVLVQLADRDAARDQGIILAGSIVRDDPKIIAPGQDLKVLISNELHEPLMTIVISAREILSESGVANDYVSSK